MKGAQLRKQLKEGAYTHKPHIAILLILIFTIAASGNFFYQHSKNILIAESSELLRGAISQISHSIELAIDGIIDVSKQVYNERRIAALMEQPDFRIQNYNVLSGELDKIKNSNRNIDSLAFYFHKNGRILYSDYGLSDMDKRNDAVFYDWYYNSSSNFILTDTHPVLHGPADQTPENMFSVFVRLPMNAQSNFDGALLIYIEQSMIYDTIIQETEIPPESEFFILDSEKNVIFSDREALLYQSYVDIPQLSSLSGEESVQQIILDDGQPKLLVSSYSKDKGWYYVMLYPFREIYNTISGMRLITIFLCIALILLGSVLILWTLNRSLAQYNELFAFIRSHLRAMQGKGNLKEELARVFLEKEVIERDMHTLLPLFQEKFFLSLLIQHRHSREMIEKQFRKFSVSVPLEGLGVCLFQIERSPETGDAYSDYLNALSLTGLIEKHFSHLGNSFFCVESGDRRIAAAVPLSAFPSEQLLTILEQIIEETNEKLGLSISVGVCDLPESAENLHRSYLAAIEALKYKLIYGKNRVIFSSSLPANIADCSCLYPVEKESQLCSIIKSGDQGRARTVLKQIFAAIPENVSYYQIQQFLFRLHGCMVRLAEECRIAIETDDLSLKLDKFTSIDEIYRYYIQLSEKIILSVDQNHNPQTDAYYQEILSYISQNYTSDITVEMVCEHVGLSSTYINTILKKNTGKTLIPYLNDYRIERACQMLQDREKRIMDIGEALGFRSTKYFIKIFKSIKGITPGEYRRQF